MTDCTTREFDLSDLSDLSDLCNLLCLVPILVFFKMFSIELKNKQNIKSSTLILSWCRCTFQLKSEQMIFQFMGS